MAPAAGLPLRGGARWCWQLLALLGLRWRGAEAWSPEGHKRIAQISQDCLLPRELKQVKKLLDSDLVELSGWEKEMTKKYPDTDALHWHRQEPEWTCAPLTAPREHVLGHLGDRAGNVRCDGHGAEGGSLFCALAYFFDHFAHDALLKEFPPLKEPINTPESLKALKKLPSSELTPAYYLRWLSILIGDLHQPLHWLREHDYGRAVKVLFRGEEHTLLDFWEERILRHLPERMAGDRMQKQYMVRATAWAETVPTALFRKWAKEVAEVVCHQVYAPIEQKNGTKGEIFLVDENLFHRWVDLAEDFTVLAGQRLAFVLHDIVEHRRHKMAHKEGRGRHSFKHRKHKRPWIYNFGMNVFCALTVVPGLLLFFRWHSQNGGPSLFHTAKEHLKL